MPIEIEIVYSIMYIIVQKLLKISGIKFHRKNTENNAQKHARMPPKLYNNYTISTKSSYTNYFGKT